MDIDNLEAGPETDALIAEHGMEWHKLDDGGVPYWCFKRTKAMFPNQADDWLVRNPSETTGWAFTDFDREDDCYSHQWLAWKGVWRPSQDIEAAWEVLEKIASKAAGWVIRLRERVCDDGTIWECDFGDYGEAARGETVSLAICRAALKTMGVGNQDNYLVVKW